MATTCISRAPEEPGQNNAPYCIARSRAWTSLTPVCAQVTLDPCSKKNENEGTFNQGVFYAGGAQYEAD